jgi:hypothetical protein
MTSLVTALNPPGYLVTNPGKPGESSLAVP